LVGGKGTHICAFDLETGKENWRALTSPEQGYAPPAIVEAAGVRQLILLRPNAVSALDPVTGKEYWSTPYDASNGSIIMAPVRTGDFLFVGGYSNKNLMLKLRNDKPGVEVLWRNKPKLGMSPVNVQPFLDGDVLYGFDQKGVMRALSFPSGKRLWETSDVIGKRAAGSETAFIVRHEDRYVLFNELGELMLAKLQPDGYHEISRAKVLEPTNLAFGREVVWSMPAFANRHAYVRNDKEIICVDLAE
jgi:hypothetical protein